MKSVAEKKAAKAEYDRKRRIQLRDEIRAKKKAAYAIWGPAHRELERERRKKNMQRHVEYCRRPEYKAKKKEYDHARMHGRHHPDYIEAARMLHELQKEIRKQEPDRDNRYRQAQRHQWSPATYAKRREERANAKIINLESICI